MNQRDPEENFDFASYFNHLLQTKTCVDVTFILETGDGEIKLFAHQLVLAMRSPYFADMFYGDQKEKENKVIRLREVNPKTFEDMIRYCYDLNPDLERFEEIYFLFKVAYHFKVISLMILCRKRLRNTKITPRNVFSLLEVSKYEDFSSWESCEYHRYECCKFLEGQTKCTLDSYEMTQITPAMVQVILGLPRLSLYSEYELICWLINWAHVKVEEGDTICKSAREYLQNYLQDMNLLSLTCEEFAKLCKDYPDFFTLEEIACICLNIAHPGVREMPDWYNKEVKIREYNGSILRAKLIQEDISEARKCITDILAIEEVLTEFLSYISESDKRFKEKISRLSKQFLLNFYVCHALKRCKNIRKSVCDSLKNLKREELETFTKESETFTKESEKISKEIIETFDKMGVLLQEEDDGFGKQIIEMAEEDERLESTKKKGTFDLEFEAMRNVLENVEEILKSYKDDKRMNESLKKCRPMVIEKIKKLSEFHDKLQEKLKQLIEEKQEILSK